jgi:signal transduction histidine kinase
VLTAELDRFAQMQQTRFERRMQISQLIPPPPMIDLELVSEFKKRIIFSLLIINSSILIFSGWFGYILAGKTLNPIQTMVEDQKRFISDASHELRTPITAMKTTLEVALRDKSISLAEAKEIINQNLEDVNKLQHLSDSLLQLSDFQHQPPLKTELIQVSTLISEAVEKIQPLAKLKKIAIKTKTVKATINGDQQSLQNVLVILLDNAVKYSAAQSKIDIQTLKQSGQLIIKVIDTGEGIKAKDLPHIFDRFYRADAARSKHHGQGYGLGLAIAQRIIASHHGSIEVASKFGQGSIFTIKLPLKTS